jgi:hypothetical protein
MKPLPVISAPQARAVFLDIVAHPGTTIPEIAGRLALERVQVTRALGKIPGYVAGERTVAVQRGHYTRWTAIAFEVEVGNWPASVPRELPSVRAALPRDRSLRPHVGVVILLDQPRKVA